MPKISSYSNVTPTDSDSVLGTDASASNATVNFLWSAVKTFFHTSPTFTGDIGGGTGIKFNGDTAEANRLDDYEEGTWTPAFGNIGSGTYTTQLGSYTKVGNMVTITCTIQMATIGTASGDVFVTGLPFACNATHASVASSVMGNSFTTPTPGVLGLLEATASQVNMLDSAIANLDHSALGTGRIRFALTYMV